MRICNTMYRSFCGIWLLAFSLSHLAQASPASACTEDLDCSGMTPVCDTSSSSCRACIADFDCVRTAGSFACQPSGACGECSATNFAACYGTTPVCNAATGMCRGCLTQSECSSSPGEPFCNASGACVECIDDTQCGGGRPYCNANGACVACTDNTQCRNVLPPKSLGDHAPDDVCFSAVCNAGTCGLAQGPQPLAPECEGCCQYVGELNSNKFCQQTDKFSCTANRGGFGGGMQCTDVGGFQNSESVCKCTADSQCDDFNLCTAEHCDVDRTETNSSAYDDECVRAPVPNGSACDDGAVCSGPDQCTDGFCGGGPLDCDDANPCTDDSCSSPAGCTHSNRPAGAPCVDADFCNGFETCDAAGQCMPGVPVSCDDNNPCTVDTCGLGGGCQYSSVAAGTSCSDGNACNGNETCSAAGFCQLDFANAPPDGSPCDDGDPCTGSDTCSAFVCTGVSDGCDDHNPCTQDACAVGGCVHDSSPSMGCNVSARTRRLVIHDDANDKKDRLSFNWSRGNISFADLGDPTATNDYALCVYDQNGLMISVAATSGAQSCGKKPCWRFIGKVPSGVKYKDGRKPALGDGVKSLVAKASPTKGKVVLNAGGVNLPTVNLSSLAYPVTAQVRTRNASCWQATFTAADEKKNNGVTLKAVHREP